MKENDFNVSSVLFQLSSVVLVLFITNYCWKRRKLYYYAAKIKGPFALPFLGSIHLFIKSPDVKQCESVITYIHNKIFLVSFFP
jgi:hypothetical protein